MRYKISNAALADLESIWQYTATMWSIEQADYYIDLIINEIEYLSLDYRNGKDCSHIRQGYFKSKVKAHLVFYRMNVEEDVIEVIRILHERMDINSRLDE